MSIITVTDRATKQIKKIMDSNSNSKKTDGILLGIENTGCNGYSYKIDFANKSEVKNYDFILTDGVKIYIDPKAVMFIIGSEMDYSTDKLSSKFSFNNPNEKGSCGCGESFNI
mgnify:CR=1 FL=1